MRLKIVCQLANEVIDQDYRRKVMSLVKKGLEATNPELYQKLFSTNVQKFYTFSVFMKNAQFKESSISIPDKQLIINFSTGDAELAVSFYNVFQSLKGKEERFGKENTIILKELKMIHQAEIVTSSSLFRTLSPIVCRNHDQQSQKDWFYSVIDFENFEKTLKANLYYKLVPKYGEFINSDIDGVVFTPLKMKKTVIKHYDKSIEASLGSFELQAAPYLLNELRDNGIASLCGGGFGMIETI